MPQQRHVQRMADLFNSDEAVWRSLEKRRRLRRKLLPLTKEQYAILDRLEFIANRKPDDCIAVSDEPRRTTLGARKLRPPRRWMVHRAAGEANGSAINNHYRF